MEILTRTTSFFSDAIDPLKFDYKSLAALERFRRPTIFLGLGGGGTKAVSYVKDMFCRTFAGKVEPGAGELPAGFQFLAFDSSVTERPGNLDAGTEWIQLDGRGVTGTEWDRLKQDARFRDWAPQHFAGVDFPQGCSGYRTLGRFLFNVNIAKFQSMFRSHYDAAMMQADENTRPIVYVFCTLAGGTGSGCLLDACFHLRATYPGLAVFGFLALPEGFGTDHALHQRAKVGVFAALKEVDHFMSPRRLDDWITEQRRKDPDSVDENGVFRFPMNPGVIGKYTKPFDCCFPFGTYDNRNVLTLEKSESMSAFMARAAFSLAAYPPSPTGGQGFEAARSNFGDQLLNQADGANVGYMVPGIGGLHAPVEHALDLLACQCGMQLLDHLGRGNGNSEHREEAETFLSNQSFTTRDLEKLTDILIEVDGVLPDVERAANFERYEAILKNPKERHEASAGALLRAPFAEALEQDLKQAAAERISMREPSKEEQLAAERDPSNPLLQQRMASLIRALATFKIEFVKRSEELSHDKGYRKLGVEDFVKDTLSLLEASRRQARGMLESADQSLASKLQTCWRQGTEFRSLLENLLTDSGWFDFERHLQTSLIDDYGTNLREIHGYVRDWVTQKCVHDILDKACAFVEGELDKHSTLYANYHSARSLLEEKASKLERVLLAQAKGLVDEVDVILSKNIMDRGWRERFLAKHKIDFSEESCAAMVQRSIAKGRQGGDGRHPWRSTEWSPLSALRMHEDPAENPARQPLPLIIAQDMANTAIRSLWDDFQPFSVWANGEGILRAFEYAGNGADGADKSLVESMLAACKPQYDLSETTRLNVGLQSYTMFAGPSGVADSLLQNVLGGHTINRVDTYETHRVTLVSFTYPVGLPICARVRIHLQAAYDAHFVNTKDDDEARRFHAYPGARSWRNPYEIDEPPHPAVAAFCKAILVGEALGDGTALSDSASGKAVAAALAEMDRLSSAPRTKQLAAFAAGGSQFWLAPFCALDVTAGTANGSGVPVKLGDGILTAFESMSRSAANEASANAWAEWFAENKSAIFTDKELESLRAKAVASYQLKVARATDEAHAKAWKRVLDQAQSDFLYAV